MSATDLSKLIANLPDDALVPVGWVRARLAAPLPEETVGDLSCADIGKVLDRKPGTVRAWLFRGELKGYRLNGKDWRCTRAELRRYLDAQGGAGSHVGEKSPVNIGSWREKRRGH